MRSIRNRVVFIKVLDRKCHVTTTGSHRRDVLMARRRMNTTPRLGAALKCNFDPAADLVVFHHRLEDPEDQSTDAPVDCSS